MSKNISSPVLQPVTIGGLHLKNRVVMAPMTRSRSNEAGVPPEYAADYYAQRAGAGLIVTEATNISSQARGYPRTPGIWTEDQITAWKKVTEAVHRQEGKIFLQLWHTGRISHPDMHDGALPVAPSAIKPGGQIRVHDGMKDFVTPRALETHEIALIVEDYRRAAENAKRAGFDGVEVHSANNYLLEQFVRDSTNHRTDQYGGSIENRLRFPLDVVKAVVDVWGADRVGIRISPVTTAPGETPLDSNTMETFGAYLDALSDLGLLYVHDIEGVTQLSREASNGIRYEALRERFKGAYIANNQYTLGLAEKTLAEGSADLFSIGRPFIANPDLIERLRVGAPLAEAPKEYWYGGDSTGYSDWPGLNGRIAVEV
ncbi:alkene reductase [Burkholderia sp. Ac-20365]|uniref:alkene reductase n=1 Tax=Burkholderia sp. Ac-20365 TaxID=2703897 RepID=UPI00197C6023|nr:alkene reductase [Burkholderia sp. Ac-20365]MBN3761622.1 alkene reductase [Burkholderia sp. Ac-20365]